MKALTVKQPYAQFIADGQKTIEVRSWVTKYRGELLITASAKPVIATNGPITSWNGLDLPLGVTVCVVNLQDIRPFRKRDEDAAICDYSPDQNAWILKLLYLTRHHAVKGKVGLWDAPGKIISKA
jgi:hypothetical protein